MNWTSFAYGVAATLVAEVVLVIGIETYLRWRNRDIGTYMKDWDRRQ